MNKGRLAPIAYFAMQFFFLACLVLSTRSMIEFTDSMYMIAYWVIVGITMGFYLLIHFKDPGFVPYDAIFFTDQEQVPEPGIIKKCTDSTKTQNLNIAEDGLSTKRQTKIELSHAEYSKSINPQENSHSLAWLKPKTKQLLPPLTLVKNIELTIKESGRQINDHTTVPTHVRNNANFGIINCEPTEEDEEAYYYPDAQTNDVIREEEETHHEAQSVAENNDNQGKQAPVEVERGLDSIEEKNEESDGSQFHKGERILSQDTHSLVDKLGDLKTQTQSEIKELKELKTMDMTNDTDVKTGVEDKSSKRVSVDPCSSTQREIANIMNKEGFAVRADQCRLEEKYLYSQENELSTVTCEPSVHREEANVTKEPDSTRKSLENINIEEQIKDPEVLKEGEVSQKKPSDDAALFIERRYCLICNIDQPLRSKHCNKCNKCVARYDHHCPWLGLCVGERNHLVFYWFLVFQLAQLAWSETELIRATVTINADDLVVFTVLRSLLAIAIGCFGVFVLSLLVFQSYLACKNLTTWERLSWNKITYLAEWKKSWGSPFSKGIVQNLLFFCFRRKRELRRWKMPKYKRPLNKQAILT